MTGTTGLTLRPATAADMADVHAVVVRSGLRSGRDPAALEFYRASPGGRVIVACQDDRVAGVSYAVSFGRTGWIGNVGVDPRARGRGLGTAVSRAALDTLRAAGVTTVLLTATDLGRPIYERLGFCYDGMHYGVWQRETRPTSVATDRIEPRAAGSTEPRAAGRTEPRATDRIEPRATDRIEPGAAGRVELGTAGHVRDQDPRATGEDRCALFGALAGRVRVPVGGGGYRVSLPWGSGPVIASTETAARTLLADLVHTEPEPFLAFPEPNTIAAKLATSLGFQQVRRIPRMRLGPPVPGFRPERIFSVLSFAVG